MERNIKWWKSTYEAFATLVGYKKMINYWITARVKNYLNSFQRPQGLSSQCFHWEPLCFFILYFCIYGPWMHHHCSSSPSLIQPWFFSTWPFHVHITHRYKVGRNRWSSVPCPGTYWDLNQCHLHQVVNHWANQPYPQVMVVGGRPSAPYNREDEGWACGPLPEVWE